MPKSNKISLTRKLIILAIFLLLGFLIYRTFNQEHPLVISSEYVRQIIAAKDVNTMRILSDKGFDFESFAQDCALELDEETQDLVKSLKKSQKTLE